MTREQALPEMLEELRWWAYQIPQESRYVSDEIKQRALKARALLARVEALLEDEAK